MEREAGGRSRKEGPRVGDGGRRAGKANWGNVKWKSEWWVKLNGGLGRRWDKEKGVHKILGARRSDSLIWRFFALPHIRLRRSSRLLT